MKFVDYYQVMGLEPDASADDIKRTYRKLARKFHPDVSKESDSEEKFKQLGEAYQVLKDQERRREYDELRNYVAAGGRQPDAEFHPPPGWQGGVGIDPNDFRHGESVDFSDFFEAMFGQGAGFDRAQHRSYTSAGREPARGQDIHSSLSLPLRDAFHGKRVTLSLGMPEIQPDGSIRQDRKTLQVQVPAGATHGQKLRLRGQGGPGANGAPAGDLYIEIAIDDDAQFKLDGKDVLVALAVTPWEAALGASRQVPTLGGDVRITIPANARAGQKLRLKGRGMPGEPAGNQIVTLNIVIPEVRTEEQKEAYRALSRLWAQDSGKAGGD